jgi:two-component system, LytTR family, response regulator
MKVLPCIIVDDEQMAVDILAEYVQRTPFLSLRYATTNPLEAVQWLATNEAALCFTDVEMPELNGLELIRTVNGRCRFILCTAYSNYGVKGFEYDVIDFLLKPVQFERFLKAAQKALQVINPATATSVPDWIFIKNGQRGSFVKVPLEDVIHIKAADKFVHMYTATQKFTHYATLTNLEAQLLPGQFIRVHKSHIVSIRHILKLDGSVLTLQSVNEPVAVGRSYREALLAALNIKGE